MRGPGRQVHRRGAILAAVAVVLTACGSGSEDTTSIPEGAALLDIIEETAEVADVDLTTAAVGDFRPGQDGESLVVGERVRTPVDGFTIVQWLDGIVTHVQSDSTYTLVDFSIQPDEVRIVTRLDVGRTWHKVRRGAGDQFEVETAVGTAAVRGTAFGVVCLDEDGCTFSVAGGTVNVTTTLGIEVDLRAGEQVHVAPSGVPQGIEPFTELDDQNTTSVRTDITDGRDYDVEVILPEGGSNGTLSPPSDERRGRSDEQRGRLEGTYDLQIEITDSNFPEQIGGKQTRVYAFFPDCGAGPCGGGWDPGDGNRTPFTWTGAGYAAAFVDRDARTSQCNAAGAVAWAEDFVFTITPTTVEAIDGELVVTEFTHEWDTVLDPTPEAIAAGCVDERLNTGHVVGTGVLRR